MTSFEINAVRELPLDEFDALLEAARAEGFRALDRLVDDWQAKTNRFDRLGEALFVARSAGALIGIGGLVDAVEAHARETFSRLVLCTSDANAAAFYTALGYRACDAVTHTHQKQL